MPRLDSSLACRFGLVGIPRYFSITSAEPPYTVMITHDSSGMSLLTGNSELHNGGDKLLI